MEIIATFATDAAGSAAAGATAAGTALAGTAIAGTAAGATLLQGTSGVFSVLTGFVGAHLKKQEIEAQAAQSKFEATDEFIAGQFEQAKLKKAMMATIGNQALAFAEGGVSLASHGVGVARKKVTEDAENELAIAFNNSERRRLAKIRQSKNLQKAANSVMVNQAFKSIDTGLDIGVSMARRGATQGGA